MSFARAIWAADMAVFPLPRWRLTAEAFAFNLGTMSVQAVSARRSRCLLAGCLFAAFADRINPDNWRCVSEPRLAAGARTALGCTRR